MLKIAQRRYSGFPLAHEQENEWRVFWDQYLAYVRLLGDIATMAGAQTPDDAWVDSMRQLFDETTQHLLPKNLKVKAKQRFEYEKFTETPGFGGDDDDADDFDQCDNGDDADDFDHCEDCDEDDKVDEDDKGDKGDQEDKGDSDNYTLV